MCVGRGRTCGTRRIVYIASFSNLSNVLDTNIVPQMDKARRLRRE